MDSQNVSSDDSTTATEVPAKRGLTGKLKDAGILAARQAERVRLTNSTLPSAFIALGRSISTSEAFRSEFPTEFAEIERINDQLAGIKSDTASRHTQAAQGITAKAKAAAAGVKDAARVKLAQHRLKQAILRLGQAVYERHGETSGPAEVVAPITAARSRLIEIDAEIARLSSASAGHIVTPKRLMIGAIAVILGVLFFGLLGIVTHTLNKCTP